MTFRRGASLTTATALGHADTADLGPTVGNGFLTRWPDDLAALQQLGITDVRVSLDWARLQPKPAALDNSWAELFEQMLRAADAIGMRPWACLHDESIPRWFDDEGGFGNDEAFTTWWPRWVERAADRFGDLVGGWVPFACIPGGAPGQPWTDTWGILAGGPPVVAAVDLRSQAGTVGRYAGRMDRLGAVLAADWDDDQLDAAGLTAAVDRWGGEIREAADEVDRAPVVASFHVGNLNANLDADHGAILDADLDANWAGDIVGAWRSMLDDALGDGVPIELAFLEPAIAGPESPHGLLDTDRASTPSSAAFID